VSMNWTHRTGIGSVALLALLSSGCGDLVRQGRSPVQLVINSLEASSGATPGEFGGTLLSDVQTLVDRDVNGQTVQVATTFNDVGQVVMSLILKDQGQAGIAATPSPTNAVTITRYRVSYRRTDGRNTQGVDVPFAFDSGVTFTVPPDGTVEAGFELVRHTAKQEAPLATLTRNPDVISTIAEVTFFGHDMAGNDISVTGTLGINFGNFADPD
jgi:hypothetical protein